MSLQQFYRGLLGIQSVYMGLTGLWGLIDIESFMAVTGPKTDIWLVRTVSALILCLTVFFVSALFLRQPPLPVILTCLATTASLAFVDFYYTAHKVIRWVYAVDGAVETLFMLGWILLLTKHRQLSTPPA